MHSRSPIPILSIALAISIVGAWVLVAIHLHQPVFASQKSSLLLTVGAIDGAALARGQAWRLLTSQFLHVHVMHMLFNVAAIALIGSAIERRAGTLALTLTYFVGGTVGQYFSVMLNPELVSSGASQAMMALCGFALIGLRRFSLPAYALIIAAIVAAGQFALDVYVSGAIKPGHSVGFAAGMLAPFAALVLRRGRAAAMPSP